MSSQPDSNLVQAKLEHASRDRASSALNPPGAIQLECLEIGNKCQGHAKNMTRSFSQPASAEEQNLQSYLSLRLERLGLREAVEYVVRRSVGEENRRCTPARR